jgi:ABC-type transporter MlaC component
MKLIGDKESFAFEIADHSEGHMRVVDIWINGISICCDDNTVYLPQFIGSLDYFLSNELGLKKYGKYFHGLTPEEIHRFIESTRDEGSENYDIPLCQDISAPSVFRLGSYY